MLEFESGSFLSDREEVKSDYEARDKRVWKVTPKDQIVEGKTFITLVAFGLPGSSTTKGNDQLITKDEC